MGRALSPIAWSPDERARIHDAVERLNTLHLGRPEDPLSMAIDVLSDLGDARRGGAYSLTRDVLSWRVFESGSRGFADASTGRLTAALDQVASSAARFGLYDAGAVEPAQRNAAIASAPWSSVVEGALPEALRRLPLRRDEFESRLAGTTRLGECMKPFGIYDLFQLRVLVCEGGVAQTWVGVYREEAFTPREVARVQAAMTALASRLRAARRLGHLGLPASLTALLEHIAGEAYVVNAEDIVVLANAAGQTRLDADGAALRARVALAARGGVPGATSTPVVESGIGPMRLVVLASSGDVDARACRSATTRYGLTPRESEVLRALLGGASNLSIAGHFECSERTVEVHVSRILRKTECANRAELVGRVLREAATG